jgi:magnesium-transporting ATPase (P-type)
MAISHGRTIYNNIHKSVHFLLATNLSEIMVMFMALTVGLGQPLNAMQLLWINLISDIAPGLALALESPEPDVLPALMLAVGGSLALQCLTLLIPGLRGLLGLTPLTLLDSIVVGQSAVLPLVVHELTKKHTRGQQP